MNFYHALRITLTHVIDQIVSGKAQPYQRHSLGGVDLIIASVTDPHIGETLAKCGGAFAATRGLGHATDSFIKAHNLGDRPFIAVASTFAKMDRKTLMFVIAHEYGHVRFDHLNKIAHLAYQQEKIEEFFCDPSNTFDIEADAFAAQVVDKQTGYQLLDNVYSFMCRQAKNDISVLVKMFDGKSDLVHGSMQCLNNRLMQLQ